MYYAVNKNGEKLQGYTDPQYKGGLPLIETAMMYCCEDGHVEDENGNIVWTWADLAREN